VSAAHDSAVQLVDADTKAPAPGDVVRSLIEPRKVEVLNKLCDLAAAGDPRSIELYLKYIAPPAKPDAERIHVPGLREAPTVALKSEAIINAVSHGLISVEAGERVARLLELHTKAVTVQDLAEQLEALKSGRAPPVLPLVQRVEPDNFDDLA
jgi:hypothetical protein